MTRLGKHLFWLSAIAITLFGNVAYAQKPQPVADLAARVAAMERWLGSGENGQKWSGYLKLPELKAQIAQPEAARREDLQAALARFQSGAPGLTLPQFVAVRTSLAAWLDSLPPPSTAEIAAQAAEVNLRPVSDAEFQAAQAKLSQAMANLDRFLGKGAGAQGWKSYLGWDTLQGVATATGPVDEQQLEQAWLKLNSGRPGLQLPQFAAVRQALDGYRRVALVHGNADAQANLEQRLQQLSQLLGSATEAPSSDTTYTLGQLVGWLDRRGQAPQVVADLRRNFAYPNLRMHMSERLISLGVERTVNRTEPVTDVILGTNISGTGHTVGRVTAQLVPSSDWAIIDSVFSGTTRSRTLGRNGPARINSAGNTSFEARKRMYLDAEGLKTSPTSASAETRTQTLGVSAGRGGLFGHIADSIAAGRVAQNKSRSQQIASEHAEERISSRLDKEANPELGRAHEDYLKKIRWPLLDDGAFPASMKFSTSNDYLYGVGKQADINQLAAGTRPPQHSGPSDVGVRVHQSAIDNLAESSLAGDEVHEQDFQDWVVDLTGSLPERLKSEPGKAPWMITFAPQRPVTVVVEPNQVTIVLRVQRVEGVVSSRNRWEITAVYKIEKTPGGLRAVRPEPIVVAPPGFKEGDALGGQVVAERRNIQRQFEEDLFTTPIEHEGLTLPGEWGKKAGKLPLVEYVTGDGWILLGWLRP